MSNANTIFYHSVRMVLSALYRATYNTAQRAIGGTRWHLLTIQFHGNPPTGKLLSGPAKPDGLPMSKAAETTGFNGLDTIDGLGRRIHSAGQSDDRGKSKWLRGAASSWSSCCVALFLLSPVAEKFHKTVKIATR